MMTALLVKRLAHAVWVVVLVGMLAFGLHALAALAGVELTRLAE